VFYQGVVESVELTLDQDRKIKSEHLVAFDDGDEERFDLAEEEEGNRLRWLDGDEHEEEEAVNETRSNKGKNTGKTKPSRKRKKGNTIDHVLAVKEETTDDKAANVSKPAAKKRKMNGKVDVEAPVKRKRGRPRKVRPADETVESNKPAAKKATSIVEKEESKKADAPLNETSKKADTPKRGASKKAETPKKEESNKPATAKKEELKKPAATKKEELKKSGTPKKEDSKKAATAKKEELKKAAVPKKKPKETVKKEEMVSDEIDESDELLEEAQEEFDLADMPESIDGIIRYMDRLELGKSYYARQQSTGGGCSDIRGKLRAYAKKYPEDPAVAHWVRTKKWQPPNAASLKALIYLLKSMIR